MPEHSSASPGSHPATSRRAILAAGLAGLGALLAGCDTRPSVGQTAMVSAPHTVSRHVYGSDPSQWGELYLPTGPRRPGTVVVIHGGFWRSEYGADLGAPLAADLAGRGWPAWNLEYRRVGNGGGWPQTFEDVAAGIDELGRLEPTGQPLDLDRVVAIGHSAGGQLACWAAGRGSLAAGSPGAGPRVALTGVLAQAGVLDLVTAARQGVGGSAVADLLGGSPDQVPERYRTASPQAQLPLRVPVRCLHSPDDQNVPFAQSVRYVAAARKAGAAAELLRVEGDHFALIDVGSPAWQTAVTALAALTG